MADASIVFEEIQDVIVARIMDRELTRDTGGSLHVQMPQCTQPPKVVLDLSKIEFIGSIGLTVLVVFQKRISTAGGRLAIAGFSDSCREVMTVTRLDHIFEFYPNVEQSVTAMQTA
ncbi:MAG: STAS domain-containing protein [Phycisphaerales bacterium]|jgi:anti-anti-sigma factor|nr:STAS domain-containing protein [Phycisphaerales bacterium]